jgi:hypothetical protein
MSKQQIRQEIQNRQTQHRVLEEQAVYALTGWQSVGWSFASQMRMDGTLQAGKQKVMLDYTGKAGKWCRYCETALVSRRVDKHQICRCCNISLILFEEAHTVKKKSFMF